MYMVKDIIRHLESIAPPAYQEDYDNSGLLVGSPDMKVTGVLTCLDVTEAVLQDALDRGCNLVVTHHPIVFKGLKRLNGHTYVERVVIEAIRKHIAIYAIHTNLDNMYYNGVNTRIAERLKLQNTRILVPKNAWRQVRLPWPEHLISTLRTQLLDTQVGELLSTLPDGQGVLICEIRFDYARHKNLEHVLSAIHAPSLAKAVWQNALHAHPEIGAGIIGDLSEPLPEKVFLDLVKDTMKTSCIRHTALLGKKVQKVALCGGSGSVLLQYAIAQGADAYITSDFKYHEFFDADGKTLIADIGHYESEQFTISLLQEIISQKFSNFAVYCTKTITNPVSYY